MKPRFSVSGHCFQLSWFYSQRSPFMSWKLQTAYPATVLISWRCSNKRPETRGLKQEQFILSQFRKPEVRKRGVCRIGLFGGLYWRSPSMQLSQPPEARLSLARGRSLWPLPGCHRASSVCLFASNLPLFPLIRPLAFGFRAHGKCRMIFIIIV